MQGQPGERSPGRSEGDGEGRSLEPVTMDVTLSELYRVFRAANDHFYQGRLVEPMIVVQSRGRKRALGWFTTEAVWTATDGGRRYEITVTAEWLGRGVEEVMETLLHEMVHLYNRMRQVRDVSGNQYHNDHFREAAEKHGLAVERSESHGWAHTTLQPATREWLATLEVNPAAFTLARKDRQRRVADPEGMAGKLKRFACGCTNIRSITWVDAVCRQCGKPFVYGAKAPRQRRDPEE